MTTELRLVNEAERGLDRRVMRTQLALGSLGAVISGAGLIWAVRQVQNGSLTLGDLTLFVAAVAGVQAGLGAQVRNIATIHQGLLRFGHHLAVLTIGPDLPEPARPLPLPRLTGRSNCATSGSATTRTSRGCSAGSTSRLRAAVRPPSSA
jgi:ATP-binding cassette, subfamily B, bacterial